MPSSELRPELEPYDKDEQNNYSGMKPVWQIDIPFKCPVIRACLNVQKLKTIFNKTAIWIKHLNPYQVQKHNNAVQCQLERHFAGTV